VLNKKQNLLKNKKNTPFTSKKIHQKIKIFFKGDEQGCFPM
jgi:hypothetical protein